MRWSIAAKPQWLSRFRAELVAFLRQSHLPAFAGWCSPNGDFMKMLLLLMAGLVMGAGNLSSQAIIASEASLLKISNDRKLPFVQRRAAAVSFCRGYIRAGMTLRDLHKLMAKTTWLRYEHMWIVKDVAGFLPFELTNGDCCLGFDLVSEKGAELPSTMYLIVAGSHSDKSLERWIVEGDIPEEVPPLILNVVVCDFNSGPGPGIIDPPHTLHVTSDQVF